MVLRHKNNIEDIVVTVTKKIDKSIIIGSSVGVVILIFGLLRFIYFEPNVGINIKTQLPRIINGTYPIVLGIGVILGSLYSLKIRSKLIKKEVERIIKEKEERRNRHKFR